MFKASCELPTLMGGKYARNYREGMVVGHGTEVDYHCDGEYQKMAPGGPAKCHLGEWRPNKPACFHPSYIHGLKNFTHDKDNKLITSIKRSCGVPQKEKGAIFYVEGKPIDYEVDFMYNENFYAFYVPSKNFIYVVPISRSILILIYILTCLFQIS